MTTTTKDRAAEDTEARPVPNTQRAASTEWIYISEMQVTPAAQRKYQPGHAAEIAADFDLEALGYPVINLRDGVWWIVDGQHRVGALKIMGWDKDGGPKGQKIECEVYRGLTEAQEADLFLRRDKRKVVHPGDKFRIGVNAGREVECRIKKLADDLELRVGIGSANQIQAVGTLTKVYKNGGEGALGRTLLIIREAYGDTGFRASIIGGIGLLIQRYGNLVTTERVVDALQRGNAGAVGLEQKANAMKRSTGYSKESCVAASVVEAINRTRGKKIPDWFRKK